MSDPCKDCDMAMQVEAICEICKNADKYREQVQRLEKSFRELRQGGYIRHKESCHMGQYNSILSGKGCTCGLTDFMKGGEK